MKVDERFYLGIDLASGKDESAVVAIEDGKVLYVEEQLTHAQMVEMVRFLERRAIKAGVVKDDDLPLPIAFSYVGASRWFAEWVLENFGPPAA